MLAGRYGLGAALGQGGSSVVHHGFDNTLKRSVAIKIFDEAATDVLREARTAAGLSHPNIAQVYDYGEVVDGSRRTPFLVMEFVDGETLADRLVTAGAMRWRQAAEICAETACALAAAHAQNLVHRDVKPGNIMLTADGVKVLDFGIAAAAGHNSVDINGALWGSPAHLAPEQLRGEPVFPSADVYALGLVLFECLTGSRAWPGASLGEILATRHGRPAPRLPRFAGLPRELVRLYEASTAEDPAARPSATELAEAFRLLTSPAPLARPIQPLRYGARPLTPAPATKSPPTMSQRSRRRATVMASAAVVAAVVSVFGIQLANGTATPGGRPAEAAVEGAGPAKTSPKVTKPAPSASTSPAAPRIREADSSTTTTTVRKKNRRTTPVDSPTTTPTKRPAATKPPVVSPSTPPVTTPPVTKPPTKPTEPETTTPPPTKPTEPETTTPPVETPPVETPPVTTSPQAEDDSADGARMA
ncbi:protein kinase [Actinoplanes sp. Pm04-4]|uniref:non-specific serine/threonine protein kinase n=1 Tax=Paractinoplanes pyxinae TaxID=2997416 RepID=A0ABT4AR28_9ACTN|nr:serine/threonine-protein kinase [Actinoplanes pyxinae]MCY1136691.1 protein kinase [Actinoplanes pyxinae]